MANKVRYLILALSFLFYAVGLLFEYNYLDFGARRIYFKEKDHLEWSDFTGLSPLFFKPKYSDSNNNNFAKIEVDTEFSTNSDGKILIETVFYPKASDIKDAETASNEMLEHENYHYKLQEVVSRLARLELIKAVNLDVDYLEGKYSVFSDSLHDLYDKETRHSVDTDLQKKWENKIDYLLDSANLEIKKHL